MPPDIAPTLPTILVVDDTPEVRDLLADALRQDYQVITASNGMVAIAMARSASPDLVLLDVMMPGMDGFAVCRTLKQSASTCDIPVVFLTSGTEEHGEVLGFEAGAADYIRKPLSLPLLRVRVAAQMRLKLSRDKLAERAVRYEEETRMREQEVGSMQNATIVALASLVEARDNETGNHIRRTQHYVRLLARQLQPHPRFRDALTDDVIATLFKSAPLHDIGKVGIQDHILLKPGKLTPEEFEVMKTHTTLGAAVIARAEAQCGSDQSFLSCAREIAQFHHEKWDGSGYPEGRAGDAIPLSARLMAIADVYDALVSRRIYKPAFPHEQAVRIITAERGRHFDPDMVDAFLMVEHEFDAIALRYSDADIAFPLRSLTYAN